MSLPPFFSYAPIADLKASSASFILRSSRFTTVSLIFDSGPHCVCVEPLSFFFFFSLIARSRVIFTHSPSTSFTGHDWCHSVVPIFAYAVTTRSPPPLSPNVWR